MISSRLVRVGVFKGVCLNRSSVPEFSILHVYIRIYSTDVVCVCVCVCVCYS